MQMLIDHHYRHPIDCCDEVAQVSIFLGVLCSVILGISDMHLILLWGSYLWCFGLHFGIPLTGICLFLGNIPWRRFQQPSKVPCLISIYTTGPLYLLLVVISMPDPQIRSAPIPDPTPIHTKYLHQTSPRTYTVLRIGPPLSLPPSVPMLYLLLVSSLSIAYL